METSEKIEGLVDVYLERAVEALLRSGPNRLCDQVEGVTWYTAAREAHPKGARWMSFEAFSQKFSDGGIDSDRRIAEQLIEPPNLDNLTLAAELLRRCCGVNEYSYVLVTLGVDEDAFRLLASHPRAELRKTLLPPMGEYRTAPEVIDAAELQLDGVRFTAQTPARAPCEGELLELSPGNPTIVVRDGKAA